MIFISVALCVSSVDLCVTKKMKNLHRVTLRSTEFHRENKLKIVSLLTSIYY